MDRVDVGGERAAPVPMIGTGWALNRSSVIEPVAVHVTSRCLASSPLSAVPCVPPGPAWGAWEAAEGPPVGAGSITPTLSAACPDH